MILTYNGVCGELMTFNYSVFEYFKKLKVFLGTTDHVVDDYLVPNLNRKSMVCLMFYNIKH